MNRIILAIFSAGVVLLGAFYSGVKFSDARHEEEALRLRLSFKEQLEKVNDENNRQLSAALAERDKVLRDLSAARISADRLRVKSEGVSQQLARLSEASASAGDGDAGRLGKCEQLLSESAKLLGEGIGLAAEGAELSGRLNADKTVLHETLDTFSKSVSK